MSISESDINANALRYWKLTGYCTQELDDYCKANDATQMMARIDFRPGDKPHIAISNRTWQLQEGHYGAIYRFFQHLAKSEVGRTLSGPVLVHLEDGIFEHTRLRTMSVPLLGFGRSRDDSYSFLMADPAFLYSDGYCEEFNTIVTRENELGQPKLNRIFWRGAATGTGFNCEIWDTAPRAQLVLRAKQIADTSIVDAKITKCDHLPASQGELFKEIGIVGDYVDFYDFLKYRYLIDVDGYHCAWKSLFLKLASRSVVLKVESNLEQWYYNLLKPWKHYVPLRADSSDLIEIYKWLEAHPEQCREISWNANRLVESITIDTEVERVALLCKQILSFNRDLVGDAPGAGISCQLSQ